MRDSQIGASELVIRFCTGGNSERFRGPGWSQPEPDYMWTLGRSSGLDVPRPRVAGTYLMLLEIRPFLWTQQPGQRLGVLVNGTEVGNFFVSGPEPRIFTRGIPPPILLRSPFASNVWRSSLSSATTLIFVYFTFIW